MSGVVVVTEHVEVSFDELDGYVTWKPGRIEPLIELWTSDTGEHTFSLREASELAAALLTVITIARERLTRDA